MFKIVLLRHGASCWNRQDRFTGGTDIDLSVDGVEEAHVAGWRLREEGFMFDMAFSSVLMRANKTLDIVLEELAATWLPVPHSWRLNERHHGVLQGLNKADTAAQYGDEQGLIWRRSYDTQPPALEEGDERLTPHDPRHSDLPPDLFPRTECLKDTVARVVPYWNTVIVPRMQW